MNETSFSIDGVQAPINVRIDKWGVPHISAESSEDVFFAQGFVAARSRLFQLDWWRRKGLGKISEVLGDDYIERDRAARLFLYRGEMRAEWLAYGNDAKCIVKSFVRGINAWIELALANLSLLSPEFKELGFLPELWHPDDISRIRTNGLYANAEQEIARAITIRDFGYEVESLRRHLDPPVHITVPEGLDLDAIKPEILDVYRLALGGVGEAEKNTPRAPDGSNNWVIGTKRSATGRPILANDPHRALTLPSLRYLVHLKCPEFDVVGAGEPALPGVSIGHNGHVAFGLTIWSADQEDVYVYDLNPEDLQLYRYQGEWERMTVVMEDFKLPQGKATSRELHFTRHGPVLYVDEESCKAFALRAAWLEPGMAPYLCSLGNLKSTTVKEMRTALNRWGSPGLNHVYADINGDITWSPRALVPIRPNWDGLLPVPGDGRFEWQGFQHASALPTEVNPDRGWVGSANQMNLNVPGWKPVMVSHEWYAPYRMQRIEQVISSKETLGLEDCVALQNDYLSLPAVTICSLLRAVKFEDAEAENAREILASWDCVMSADSSAAALFDRWFRGPLRHALRREALETMVSHDELDAALHASMPKETLIADAVVDMELFDKACDSGNLALPLLETSLAQVFAFMTKQYGSSALFWKWGDFSTTSITHVAHDHLTRDVLYSSLPATPRSGSSETVGLSVQDDNGRQINGASFRIVVDVGEWDNTLVINFPGQDGDPRSSHYADLYDLWRSDGYFKLAYSDAAVSSVTESSLKIVPNS